MSVDQEVPVIVVNNFQCRQELHKRNLTSMDAQNLKTELTYQQVNVKKTHKNLNIPSNKQYLVRMFDEEFPIQQEKVKIKTIEVDKFTKREDTVKISNLFSNKPKEEAVPFPNAKILNKYKEEAATIQKSKIENKPKEEDATIPKSKIANKPKEEAGTVQNGKIANKPKEIPKFKFKKVSTETLTSLETIISNPKILKHEKGEGVITIDELKGSKQNKVFSPTDIAFENKLNVPLIKRTLVENIVENSYSIVKYSFFLNIVDYVKDVCFRQ